MAFQCTSHDAVIPNARSFFRVLFSEKIVRRDLLSTAIPINRSLVAIRELKITLAHLTLTRDDGSRGESDTRNGPKPFTRSSKLILPTLHLILRRITGCRQVLWF